jgi:hypothetical protein
MESYLNSLALSQSVASANTVKMEVVKKYYLGPSPLDKNDAPVLPEHLLPRSSRNRLPIPITEAPIDYIASATQFLDDKVADPCSTIHDAITLPPDLAYVEPPADPKDECSVEAYKKRSDEDDPKPLQSPDHVYKAAKLYLKCLLDFAIDVRYPGQLQQHNNFIGQHPVTLYCDKTGWRTTEKVLMVIKWLGPNILKGIEEGSYIHPWWVHEAKALQCKYAALCDYENLVLLKVDRVCEPRSLRVMAVRREDMRKALLGFLVEACDEVFGKESAGREYEMLLREAEVASMKEINGAV